MSNLKLDIFSKPPKENSGSSSGNRFDYQKNWALCKLLELYESGNDYLLTLEFHDDIVVFNSSTNPSLVSFYQVKTADKNHWTIGSLVSPKKGKKGKNLGSFLGKLFGHILNFGGEVESLNFVTNCKIKGTFSNSTKCENAKDFKCSDLCTKDLKNIEDKIKLEHQVSDLKGFKDLMFFITKELNLDNHETITKGKLSEFIETIFPEIDYKIGPLYKAIFGEIKKKSNVEANIIDFNELKRLKSISKDDFKSYFGVLQNNNTIKTQTFDIASMLNSEGAGFQYIREFKKNAKVFEVDQMNYNDKILHAFILKVRNLIKDNESSLEATLKLSCEYILNLIKSKKFNLEDKEDGYLRAIILFELYSCI